LLYLGRQHPLKGLEFLEAAVKGIEGVELRVVSNAFGEEKERVWDWCDVLVLPTLSENFGLVVAEALERGKCVIRTDGAPAWGDGNDYGGRLVFLKGFRDGTDEVRVGLLKDAIAKLVGMDEQERMHDL
jgi:glycosyltransferase involved in cell wall biosynthesis